MYDVHCCISVDELMQPIRENHLGDQMSFERFKKKAKIVSRPIRSGPEAASNAVIEGTSGVIDRLISTESACSLRALGV